MSRNVQIFLSKNEKCPGLGKTSGHPKNNTYTNPGSLRYRALRQQGEVFSHRVEVKILRNNFIWISYLQPRGEIFQIRAKFGLKWWQKPSLRMQECVKIPKFVWPLELKSFGIFHIQSLHTKKWDPVSNKFTFPLLRLAGMWKVNLWCAISGSRFL